MPSDSSKPAWADANTLSVRKSTEKRVMGSGYYDPKDPPLRKETSTANVHDITWEHKDPQRAKESPDKVAQGDVIILSVMAEGIHAEARPGPGLDLVIINGSDRSPFLTRCKVDNRIQQNKVVVEWKVDCKVSQDGLKPGTDPVLWVSCEYNGFHGRSKADVLKIPVFVPPVCTIIEIPDTCFTAGSPIVPCLDDKGVFEGAFLALYGHVQKHPDTEAMVFGHSHSDAKADQTDRFDRSRYAAEMIRALLADDQERYVEIAGLCAEVADWQANLTGLSVHYDWNCNPTAVNNSFGPKTRQATRNFKEQCNQRYQMQLTVDEKLDDAAWKALFTVTRAIMSAAWKSASGKEVLPEITFIGQGVYPCSDSFAPNARQKGVRSKTGYRVEVGFFEKGTCPTLSPHEQKATKVEKTECPVYDDTRCTRSYLAYRNSESRVLRLKACEGPGKLCHDETGTYRISQFSREATAEERKKVSWALWVNGQEVERFEQAGDTFEFKAIGKYAGETISLHPFFNGPGQDFCVKTTVGPSLYFDGKELVWLDESLTPVNSWPAVSGENGIVDQSREGGPLPDGKWVALQSERHQVEEGNWWQKLTSGDAQEMWGTDRIGLRPFSTTETHGRKGFYLHGGEVAGTGHGIDLTDTIGDFVKAFEAYGKSLVMVVKVASAESVNSYFAEAKHGKLIIHTPEQVITYEPNVHKLVQFPECARGIARGGTRDVYEINGTKKAWGDNWCTPEFGAALYNAVQEYLALKPVYKNDIPLTYNDMSAYQPGINILGHSSHLRGTDVDFRYINSAGIGVNDYSQADIERCNDFVAILKKHGFRKFYTHNACVEGTSHWAGHKDHIHAGL